MAGLNPMKRLRGRARTGGVTLDEFGGTPDGGLAIVTDDGTVVHRTTPRVAASLRYFLAKTRGPSPDGFPERLAVTAALRGEGVSFTSRSIASVLAYDTDSTVAVIDLNWKNPGAAAAGKGRGKGRGNRGVAPPPVETTPGEPSAAVKAAQAKAEAQRDRDRAEQAKQAEQAQQANRAAPSVTPTPTSKRASNRRARSGVRDSNGRFVPRDTATNDEAETASAPFDAAAATAAAADPNSDPLFALDSELGLDAGPQSDADPDQPADGADPPSDTGTFSLSEAIEWGLLVDDILVPTANPRLTLINAGELSVARRPVVAGSKALEELIGLVAERFDHVLLDLPPVLASSDAIRLSQLADSFVLVVRHGVTSSRQVEAALDELSGIDALGVIINQFESRVPLFLRRLVGA